MAVDPYTAPQSDLAADNDDVIQTSFWKPHGRLGVMSYWANVGLLILLLMVVMGILATVATMLTGDQLQVDGRPPTLFLLILAPAFIAIFYLGICLSIKRLHDLNLVGWWSLLLLVPIIGSLFSLFVYFWPGKKTNNRYGGWRKAKGWEKVVAICLLLFAIGSVIAAVVVPGLFPAVE